jgi:hypothetical protein
VDASASLNKTGALKFVSLALKIPRPALNIARAPLKIPALALKKVKSFILCKFHFNIFNHLIQAVN